MKAVLKKLKKSLLARWLLKAGGVIACAFVLLNLSLYAVYSHHTYPNTVVADKRLGMVSTNGLAGRLSVLALLPSTVQISDGHQATPLSPSELGITPDYDQTARQLLDNRSWLPAANLFRHRVTPLSVHIDQAIFSQKMTAIAQTYDRPAVNAKVVIQQGAFSIQSDTGGRMLTLAAAEQSIASQLGQGKTTLMLPLTTVQPAVTKASLNSALTALNAEQHTAVTFRYQSLSKRLTPADIAGWYTTDQQSFVLSDANIQASIRSVGAGFGIGVQNLTQATAAAKDALHSQKSLDFTLVAAPKAQKQFTYCVAVKGISADYLPGLIDKLASVYTDARGWSLGSKIAFNYGTSNCNLTVWLADASLMPSFGAICDSTWSCTVSPNVIINFDRWRYASDSWNKSGGSLDEYRAMVINHETGHWLGFGHSNCGGPGQPAPVMQQQSIDLQGCTFNAWPLPSELTTLQARLDIQ